MKFAYRHASDCEGMLLGHSVRTGAKRLSKGHWLTAEDIEALNTQGVTQVFAGLREAADILENDAALAIANKVRGSLIDQERPHTGRCNLVAACDGLLTYSRETLIALNMADPRITLAMLPPLSPVRTGDLIGTVKIIPFAVPQPVLDVALSCWPNGKRVDIAAFREGRAFLLETQLPSVKPLSEKIIDLTTARAQRVGFTLMADGTASHHPSEVCDWLQGITKTATQNDIALIFGASATVDEADVIPAAITQAGGTVERVGMAADPGNLLVYGHIGHCTVIGLPGCAKSPALNGFDWVLERAAAGLEITPLQWAEFSVGGLLKEIEARPQPRRLKTLKP